MTNHNWDQTPQQTCGFNMIQRNNDRQILFNCGHQLWLFLTKNIGFGHPWFRSNRSFLQLFLSCCKEYHAAIIKLPSGNKTWIAEKKHCAPWWFPDFPDIFFLWISQPVIFDDVGEHALKHVCNCLRPKMTVLTIGTSLQDVLFCEQRLFADACSAWLTDSRTCLRLRSLE